MASGLLKKITSQQKDFVLYLLADPKYSPIAAARKAGYKNPAPSASKLIKQPVIAKYLKKIRKEREKHTVVTQARIIEELACIGFRDPIDLVGADGLINLEDLTKIPERFRRCIEGIDVTDRFDEDRNLISRTVKFKLSSKLVALDLLAKHHGYYAEQKVQVAATHKFDWNSLHGEDIAKDTIETKIVELENGNNVG